MSELHDALISWFRAPIDNIGTPYKPHSGDCRVNPFLEIEALGAYSSRVIGRYCHLALAAESKRQLLVFVCEAGAHVNQLHCRTEITEALSDGWGIFQSQAREFLQHAGQ